MAANRSQSLLRTGLTQNVTQQAQPRPVIPHPRRTSYSSQPYHARLSPRRLSTMQAEHRPAFNRNVTTKLDAYGGRNMLYSTEPTGAPDPVVHSLFESTTGSWQYVVADPTTSTAAVIDPVLDYDPITQAIGTKSADDLLAIIKDNGYTVDYILETHAHADHLTAASYLQHQIGEAQGHRPLICIGSRINLVQQRFSERYNVPSNEYTAVFDKLLNDDEGFAIGSLKATAMHIPGHTPDHMGYKIGDNVFTGDLIFYKDLGTARADFPGGSALEVWRSAQKILDLPGNVRVWSGHDYPPAGREAVASMTVKEHCEQNKHLMGGVSEEDFIKMRQERDAVLAAPKLIHQSLQMNIRAGRLPVVNSSGQRLLHLPLKLGSLSW